MEQAESARRVEAEYQNLLEMELAQKRQARLEEEVRRRRIELRLKEVEARQDTENLKVRSRLLFFCFVFKKHENIFPFSIISQYQNGTGWQNPP